MYGDSERVKLEFEEDSGRAAVVLDFPCVVGHAVLIGVQGRASGSDVCRRYNMQEILVRDEICSSRVSHIDISEAFWFFLLLSVDSKVLSRGCTMLGK
jgi:hypothetical protein